MLLRIQGWIKMLSTNIFPDKVCSLLILCLSLPLQIFAYTSTESNSVASFGFDPEYFSVQRNNPNTVFAQIHTQLPIRFDSPLHKGVEAKMNSHPLFSSSNVNNQGTLNNSISAGMPLYDGYITFAYTENFKNSFLLESPSTFYELDTSVSQHNCVWKV